MVKRYLFSLLVIIFSVVQIKAQYCGNSSSAICTTDGGISAEGFYPADSLLPCIIVGAAYDTVIQIHTPSTVSSGGSNYDLNSIQIDNIDNLPCGLCWASGSSDNSIGGNATGCLRIQGTTFDAPGEYLLNITVDATVVYLGINITESGQNLSSQGLKFYLRVALPGQNCMPIDQNSPGNTASSGGTVSTPSITGNTHICSGGSSTLSVAGGNYYGYVWSTGEFTSSINVSAGGTYTVTVYENCGSAVASQSVSVGNVSPNIIADGPSTICQGQTLTLDAGSGYDTYSWNTGANSQTIQVSQAGNYECTVTQQGCQGVSNVVPVSVNSNPAPAITAGGPLSFCAGGSVHLNVNGTYASYVWSDGETTSSIVASQSGNYVCTVTENGCAGASNALAVTDIDPSPILVSTGPTTLCAGEIDTLKAGTGYDSYLWSNGANMEAIGVSSSGNYWCTVTQSGCPGVSDTIAIAISSTLAPNITALPALNICPGSTATLDAGAGYNTYTWSNGSHNETINVSSAGLYVVSVTQGSCIGSASASVNVSNYPVAVNINPAGPVSLCQGSSVMLDAGADYDTYSWNTGATTESIEPGSSGFYIVTVTHNSCVGYDTTEVIINALPQPAISASGNRCWGDTVTLDAGTGFQTYYWNTGSITQSITVANSNNYIVRVSNNNCYGSDTFNLSLNPIPNPDITTNGGQSFCPGQSITLNAGSGYTAYNWSNGANTQTIQVNNSGTYTVTVTQNNCTGASQSGMTVNLLNKPAVSVTSTYIDTSLIYVLQAVTGGVIGYEWESTQLDTVNGPFSIVSHSSNDSAGCSHFAAYYRVIVTGAGGCTDTSAFVYVPQCQSVNGIAELAISNLSIEPIPANDVLQLNYELANVTPVQISVLDISGRRLINQLAVANAKGRTKQSLNIAQLSPGLYLLNLRTDKGNVLAKFVKQ